MTDRFGREIVVRDLPDGRREWATLDADGNVAIGFTFPSAVDFPRVLREFNDLAPMGWTEQPAVQESTDSATPVA